MDDKELLERVVWVLAVGTLLAACFGFYLSGVSV